MPSAKEDVNEYVKDPNNNEEAQSEENDQDENEILIIGGSDLESLVDEEEEEEEADSGQKSTIQEVLLFAFKFCADKFDYVRDNIIYGLKQSGEKVKKTKNLT